jgi:hypothetical protein
VLHQEKLLKTQDDLQAEASVVLCLEELVFQNIQENNSKATSAGDC